MDRARILEKIQKCFNLSKSPVPAEAAAALRQAQKMMALHDVSERELGIVGYGTERVSLPVQANVKLPDYLNRLAHMIRSAFGVIVTVSKELRVSDLSYAFNFYGPKDRALLAAYAFEVCFRAMNSGWTQYLRENPRMKGLKGARSGFLIGWIETVRHTVTDFALTDEEKQKLDDHVAGRDMVKANKTQIYGKTLDAGREAAEDFRLHRPITPDRLKIGM